MKNFVPYPEIPTWSEIGKYKQSREHAKETGKHGRAEANAKVSFWRFIIGNGRRNPGFHRRRFPSFSTAEAVIELYFLFFYLFQEVLRLFPFSWFSPLSRSKHSQAEEIPNPNWERVKEIEGLWLCGDFLSPERQSRLLSAIERGAYCFSICAFATP